MSQQNKQKANEKDDKQKQTKHENRDEHDDKDLENDRKDDVPEPIQSFLKSLYIKINQPKKAYQMQNIYGEFHRLTDRYYKSSSWPNADVIAKYVDKDEKTLILYKELYFRHINMQLIPSIDDRFDSFQNYIDLFNMILDLNVTKPELEIPTGWLWDMIDEFIYQFQSFHQFRHKTKDLQEDEIQILEQHVQAWSAPTVISYLHALIGKAVVKSEKSEDKKKSNEDKETSKDSDIDEEEEEDVSSVKDEKDEKKDSVEAHTFFKLLAQFCHIGLCRVNCLLGDYTSALRALDPIDVTSKRVTVSQFPSAFYTLYYYMSVSYLMLRRYVDAIKCLSSYLSYIHRSDDSQPRTNKRTEQMYGLLAVAMALAPQRLSENLQSMLREKHGDKIQKMQKGDMSVFSDCLNHALPKYINASIPDFKQQQNSDQDAFKLQIRILTNDIKQRMNLPEVYSYLKLCSVVSLPKLSSMLKCDVETLMQALLNLKHKTRNVRWRAGGSPVSGKYASSAEVNFCINKDMVMVSEHRVARRYGDFFIRQILKFEDLILDLSVPTQSTSNSNNKR